jgi:hypothetical protein
MRLLTSRRKGDHAEMVKADSGQAALARRRRHPSEDDSRGDGPSQFASRDGRRRTAPRGGAALQAADTPVNDHRVRTPAPMFRAPQPDQGASTTVAARSSKTTFAKLDRERRLREKRAAKQARKDERRESALRGEAPAWETEADPAVAPFEEDQPEATP